MSFLLDTNILSAYLKGSQPHLQSKFLQHGGQLYTSVINIGELLIWANRSPKKVERLHSIGEMLKCVDCLDIDLPVAASFGDVRSHQLSTGALTPAIDLFVACTALVYNVTLVTHNSADFANVPDLRIADWYV